MPNEKLSLKDFLETHATPAFLATVEPTAAADKVKVTPWQADRGCLCQAALEIPRNAIASVILTDNTHSCCGKSLRVVEIEFAAPGAAQMQDVFTQLVGRAAPSAVSSGAQGVTPYMAKCPWCVSICRRNPGSEACTSCWEGCYGDAAYGAMPAVSTNACPRGTEYCECIGACVAPWVCWRRCGPHG